MRLAVDRLWYPVVPARGWASTNVARTIVATGCLAAEKGYQPALTHGSFAELRVVVSAVRHPCVSTYAKALQLLCGMQAAPRRAPTPGGGAVRWGPEKPWSTV